MNDIPSGGVITNTCSPILYLLQSTRSIAFLCRRRGYRSRLVHSKRPMVGYFTDNTSMSGAATDVSTYDASDEDSSVEGACIRFSFACIL